MCAAGVGGGGVRARATSRHLLSLCLHSPASLKRSITLATGSPQESTLASSTLLFSSPASSCLLLPSVPSSCIPFSLLPYCSPLALSPLFPPFSLSSLLAPPLPLFTSFLPPFLLPLLLPSFFPITIHLLLPSSQHWRVNSEPHPFPKQLYHHTRSGHKDAGTVWFSLSRPQQLPLSPSHHGLVTWGSLSQDHKDS